MSEYLDLLLLVEESCKPNHTFGYSNGISHVEWDIQDIWDAVEKLPIKRLDISKVKEYVKDVRSNYNAEDIARIKDADLSYPIIISKHTKKVNLSNGKIIETIVVIDGFHRLCKLIDMGFKTANVKVIDKLPTPTYTEGDKFTVNGLNFDWPP
jgi:hypothetical protein